jgi:hypothetical protein
MRTLNRPMFKYGGPIKEGIMKGMKEPQAINTVGSPLAPTDSSGRQGYALPLIPLAYSGLMAAGRFLAPRAIAAGAKAFGRGLATSPGTGTSAFGKGLTIGQRFKNLLPSQRFRQPATVTRTPRNPVQGSLLVQYKH